MLNYIKAEKENTEAIYALVQNTIREIYPKYYPREVVEFFCQLHSRENIAKDIESGNVGILTDGARIVGTGSSRDDHITRVYVDPALQKRGYGSCIMQALEAEIGLHYDAAYLDASLPASHMYEKRGYITVKHERWAVENGVILVYEVMRKPLRNGAVLLQNLNRLHTTELGAARILKNLSLNTDDVVRWCVEQIQREDALISRKGKNWYVVVDGCEITINAGSYTIITAHVLKGV